jgi:hypothetical protein
MSETIKVQYGNTPSDSLTVTVHDHTNAAQIYEAVLAESNNDHNLAARCVMAVELNMFTTVDNL